MGWRRRQGVVEFVEPGQYAAELVTNKDAEKAAKSGDVVVTTTDVLPTYTEEEIAAHSTMETGIWIVVGKCIYNVTEFLKAEHPGGPDVILAFAGKQCDWQFELCAQERDMTAVRLRADIVITPTVHRREHLDAFHDKLLIGTAETPIANPYPRPPSELKASWRVE